MSIKSVSIRIEEEMLEKLRFVCHHWGRSLNSQILVLIRDIIQEYEEKYGEIKGDIKPNVNVKPKHKK